MSVTHNELRVAVVCLAMVSLAACGTQKSGPTSQHSADDRRVAANPASQVLDNLAHDVWAHQLEHSTYLRLQEGAPIDHFEGYTLEEHTEEIRAQVEWRARLAKIDVAALTDGERTTYQIIEFQSADSGATEDDFWLTFPLTAYQGVLQFQFFKQALKAHAISDKDSAGRYLHLVDGYADTLDSLLVGLEDQVARGIRMPKPAVPLARTSWANLERAAPETVGVEAERLSGLTESERATFRAELQSRLEKRVLPGFTRLLAALNEEYEGAAPTAVGLSQYPGGADVYRRRIRFYTTLDLTPEEIHRRGLQAVEEAAAKMQAIRGELGFKGSAAEFNRRMQSDKRYLVNSSEELEQVFADHLHRMEPVLPRYFRAMPKAPYGVRKLDATAAAGMTAGYYARPTRDTPTGYYHYNGSNMQNRSVLGAASLIYHELIPGHHLQIALQAENDSLPAFRRRYSASAYSEGWANYAAALGVEMGLYGDPYVLYNRYGGELFSAIRLVIDTGMNALGWTMEDARAFVERYDSNRTGDSLHTELLRYSTSIPAQALAYRLGSDKFWELRRRAEAELGDDFDIKDFHDVVLGNGALPLAVLEKKVAAYISAARKE